MQGIYRIRNKIDNKRYIGSAQDFDERWGIHRKELQKGNHYNKYLQRAWNKYGEENFVFEIEEKIKGSREDAFDREQEYLDKWFSTGLLYNVARKAGGGNLGPEVNQKISEKRKGQSLGPQSEEHKAKVRITLIGREVTEETRLKIGKANSISLTGRKLTEEHCINISKGHMGHEVTEETRAKISENNAKPYSALYNIKTGGFISAGINLTKMCEVYDFHCAAMYAIIRGINRLSRDGWRLATPEEIETYETI